MIKQTYVQTIFFFTLTTFSLPSLAGLFGPDNYEECILEEMKGVTSDVAANAIKRACRKEFPSENAKDDENLLPLGWFVEEDGVGHCILAWDGARFTNYFPVWPSWLTKEGYNATWNARAVTLHTGGELTYIIPISVFRFSTGKQSDEDVAKWRSLLKGTRQSINALCDYNLS